MYKRITTNIIEEHFDDYRGADTLPAYSFEPENKQTFAKKNKSAFKKAKLSKKKFGGVFSVVSDEDTPLGAMIKKDYREYFTAYLLALRSYIVARSSKSAEVEQVKEKLTKQVFNLSTLIQPWHTPNTRTSIVTSFEALNKPIIDYIEAVASGSQSVPDDAVMTGIQDFSKTVVGVSPATWNEQDMTERWHTFFHEIADQIWSRMKSNWVEDQAALDKSYVTLIQGSDKEVSISDVLSKGLIASQPWRFRG